MMGAIGLSVGLIGYLLFACIDILAHAKYRAVRCVSDYLPLQLLSKLGPAVLISRARAGICCSTPTSWQHGC